MLGVRLEPDLEHRLDAIVAMTVRSKSCHVRAVIRELIEDWEDAAEAIAALENPGRLWSLEEIMNGVDLKVDGLEG